MKPDLNSKDHFSEVDHVALISCPPPSLQVCWFRLSQRPDWNPINDPYRDLKRAVHRQVPWYLREHDELHVIGQVMGRNENTGKERSHKYRKHQNKTKQNNGNSWIEFTTSWAGTMLLTGFLVKKWKIKKVKVNLDTFTWIEMWLVYFKWIMVVQRDGKLCFCHWPNNFKPVLECKSPGEICMQLKWECVSRHDHVVKADMCDIFSSIYLSKRHLADALYKE